MERARTHVVLEQAEIPVTPYAIVRDINSIPDTTCLGFPQIVTQAFDDVYDDERYRSVFSDQPSIEARTKELAIEFELPFVIERYVPGRRIQACVIGNRVLEVLPLTEVILGEKERCEAAQLEPELADQIRALARRCFSTMALRDVAQIDFVIDEAGKPYVADVRPLVDFFGPVFKTAAELSEGGLEGAFVNIARATIERVKRAAQNAEAEAESIDEELVADEAAPAEALSPEA
jgi:hypothetical protein